MTYILELTAYEHAMLLVCMQEAISQFNTEISSPTFSQLPAADIEATMLAGSTFRNLADKLQSARRA